MTVALIFTKIGSFVENVLIFMPIVVTVQLFGVTWQFLAPEQRDTVKDVLLFLVQHFGIHSHCLFAIHRCH